MTNKDKQIAKELVDGLSLSLAGGSGYSSITFTIVDNSKPVDENNIVVEASGNVGVLRKLITHDNLANDLFIDNIIDTRTI